MNFKSMRLLRSEIIAPLYEFYFYYPTQRPDIWELTVFYKKWRIVKPLLLVWLK